LRTERVGGTALREHEKLTIDNNAAARGITKKRSATHSSDPDKLWHLGPRAALLCCSVTGVREWRCRAKGRVKTPWPPAMGALNVFRLPQASQLEAPEL